MNYAALEPAKQDGLAFSTRPNALVCDVDGCLGPYGSLIASPETKYVWDAFRKKIPSGFASGKNLGYLEEYAQRNGLEPDFIISGNGDMIKYGDELITFPDGKGVRQLKEVFYSELEKGSLGIPVIEENGKHSVFTVFSLAADASQKLIDVRYLDDYCTNLASRLGVHVDVIQHPDCVDIVPRGMNKDYAVNKVAELMDIDPTSILRIGDGRNDIEMLEKGLAAAPGNSDKLVIETVSGNNGYVACGLHGEGLREIYEHHFGPLDI